MLFIGCPPPSLVPAVFGAPAIGAGSPEAMVIHPVEAGAIVTDTITTLPYLATNIPEMPIFAVIL